MLIGAACAAAQETPPNIVLVISDDHGYRDYGFMGSPIVRTPNLDRHAAEGVVFRRVFSSSSVCQPSHLTLLTGLHPEQVHAQMVRLGHSRWRGNTWAATRLATDNGYFNGGRGIKKFSSYRSGVGAMQIELPQSLLKDNWRKIGSDLWYSIMCYKRILEDVQSI